MLAGEAIRLAYRLEQSHGLIDAQRLATASTHDRRREFMRRFLLHVLPSGLHCIRHYALLANGMRKSKLTLARELLHVAPAPDVPNAEPAAQQPRERPTFVCWHCGSAMLVVEMLARTPSIRAPPHPAHSP